ncbi:MAG: hypothetical protein ACI3W7_00425, partial [Oscillospiraceae bacterium]
ASWVNGYPFTSNGQNRARRLCPFQLVVGRIPQAPLNAKHSFAAARFLQNRFCEHHRPGSYIFAI